MLLRTYHFYSKYLYIKTPNHTCHNIRTNPLTLVLLNPDIPFANSADPDQLASEEEANWSGSALFVIKYENLYYEQPGQGIWLAEN